MRRGDRIRVALFTGLLVFGGVEAFALDATPAEASPHCDDGWTWDRSIGCVKSNDTDNLACSEGDAYANDDGTCGSDPSEAKACFYDSSETATSNEEGSCPAGDAETTTTCTSADDGTYIRTDDSPPCSFPSDAESVACTTDDGHAYTLAEGSTCTANSDSEGGTCTTDEGTFTYGEGSSCPSDTETLACTTDDGVMTYSDEGFCSDANGDEAKTCTYDNGETFIAGEGSTCPSDPDSTSEAKVCAYDNGEGSTVSDESTCGTDTDGTTEAIITASSTSPTGQALSGQAITFHASTSGGATGVALRIDYNGTTSTQAMTQVSPDQWQASFTPVLGTSGTLTYTEQTTGTNADPASTSEIVPISGSIQINGILIHLGT